jgi:hypothetical protein
MENTPLKSPNYFSEIIKANLDSNFESIPSPFKIHN